MTKQKPAKRMLSRIGLFLGISNQARFMRAIRADRRENPREYMFADEVLRIFHEQGGLRQYTQSYKLVCLKRLLEEYRPASILEFGTGASSLVIAKFAKESGAKVIHVDENLKWLENTKRNIQSLVGRTDGEFLHSRARVDLGASPPAARYNFHIEVKYDFVFVDGPALFADNVSRPDMVSADLVKCDARCMPSIAVVDMRRPTVEALCNVRKETHRPYVSDILAGNPRKRFRYFSIFCENTRGTGG